MSDIETHHDGVAHESLVNRVTHDAILEHLIDDSSLPHTPEEQEAIQKEIEKRFLEILQPKNKSEDE